MPLNLPDRLPAIELLKKENIFVIDSSRASSQDIRPLRIVILNLMPLKITTETDLVRQHAFAGRGLFHESEGAHVEEYAGGAHESFLP